MFPFANLGLGESFTGLSEMIANLHMETTIGFQKPKLRYDRTPKNLPKRAITSGIWKTRDRSHTSSDQNTGYLLYLGDDELPWFYRE